MPIHDGDIFGLQPLHTVGDQMDDPLHLRFGQPILAFQREHDRGARSLL